MSNIRKNFIYISVYNVMAMLLPLVTSPILSRALGAECLGIYGYVDAIVGVFIVFATTGVYRYGMREIAKVRDDQEKLRRTYANIIAINTCNILIVSAIYLLFIIFVDSAYKIFFLIKIGLFIAAIFDNAFLYCGLENMKPVTLRDAGVKIISFVLIVFLIREPEDLLLYFILMTMSSMIPAVLGFVYAHRFVKICKPDFKECRKMYFPMLILLIPMLASNIYHSMDRVMIGALFGQADVGYYLCATKVLVPRSIIAALGTAVCPNLAHLYFNNNDDEADRRFGKSLIISLIFAFIITGITVVVAQDFAPLFWGEDFYVCSSLMIGISITIPIWTIGEVIRSQYLLAKGRDNEYVITFVLGVFVNAVVNSILIPKYGASGAVAGTIAAELAMSGLQVYYVRYSLPIKSFLIQSIPYLLLTVFVVLIVFYMMPIMSINRFMRMIDEFMIFFLCECILIMIYEKITAHEHVTNLIRTGINMINKKRR